MNIKKPTNKSKEDINRLRMVLDYRWDPKYQPQGKPAIPESFKIVRESNPIETKQGNDLQAVFINLKWGQHLKIEEFKQFNLNDSQMHNGMLFIWCEKDNIMEIIDQLEKLGFNYVENFTTVLLSLEKILTIMPSEPQVRKITEFFSKKNIKEQKEIKKIDGLKNQDQLPDLDPTQVFWNENYTYFRKTKRTLLMFRKQSKQQLELRHQRTGDIFFDVIEKDGQNLSAIGMEYIYKMIETLLPKAQYKAGESLKMMELFADPNTQGRSGWIQVIQE
ncbi:unnamed protein product [Paramecium pentaurelia]|uniref:Uncharacterized protein n=1 Tax=Paramecium pentaurelia TaxID=43138 RepID=A0A8S1UHR5_9CILI|nr:unnamed protein product [Paramecium pentaurelia]